MAMRGRSSFLSQAFSLVLAFALAFSFVAVLVNAAAQLDVRGKSFEAQAFELVQGETELKSTTPISLKGEGGKPVVLEVPIYVHENNDLHFKLDLELGQAEKDFKPAQRLLSLTHSERKTKVARVAGDFSDGMVTFVVNCDKIKKEIGTLNGQYEAEVVVADKSFKTSFRKKFGPILVSHAQNADGSLASDPPLSAKEVAYQPLEEIEHLMRQPDSRPNAMVSLVFALCIVTSPLVLIKYVDFGRLGSATFFTHVLLGGMLALITAYWYYGGIINKLDKLG